MRNGLNEIEIVQSFENNLAPLEDFFTAIELNFRRNVWKISKPRLIENAVPKESLRLSA
jgi:hypothetical protein